MSDVDSVLLSTFYDQRYATNNLMRTYELEFEDGTIDRYIDYSDWNFTSIIKRIRKFRVYKYVPPTKMTTIAYRAYGNTTIYRMLMIYNGFMHPYEIGAGTTIKIPDATELAGLLQREQQKKQNSLNGQSIRI